MSEYDESHKRLLSRSYRGLKISLEGDLNTINYFMGLDRKIGAAVMAAQNRFIEKYKKALIKNFIEGGGSIGIIQDSPKFIQKKLRKGYPGIPGTLTGNLKESITITHKKGVAFVGIPRGTQRRVLASDIIGSSSEQEYSVDEYAELLERGSSKQPARPFFSYTFTKTMGGTKELGKFLRRSIAQKMSLKH